jgi:hypothetical protein
VEGHCRQINEGVVVFEPRDVIEAENDLSRCIDKILGLDSLERIKLYRFIASNVDS